MNPIHPSVFLTCSADWTVKVWNHAELEVGALFTFDLNSPVADACWAPYASTVFAACTIDGFVYVYDLNINKYAPLCKQQVISNFSIVTWLDLLGDYSRFCKARKGN